jgi:hypothetical protein
MKQRELDRSLYAVLKENAKAHKWMTSRGFVFKAADPLFFEILVHGQVKQRRLSYELSYKWLAFDELFWKIVKLEKNAKKPLSFRAWGWWTVPTMAVSEEQRPIADWKLDNLHQVAGEIIARCELDTEELSKEIRGLDDNLRVVERLYARHMDKYPGSARDLSLYELFRCPTPPISSVAHRGKCCRPRRLR